MSVPQINFLTALRDVAYPFTTMHSNIAVNKVFADLFIIKEYDTSDSAIIVDHVKFQSGQLTELTIKNNSGVIFSYPFANNTKLRKTATLFSDAYRTTEFYTLEDDANGSKKNVIVKCVLDNNVLTNDIPNYTASSMNLEVVSKCLDMHTDKVNSIHDGLSTVLTDNITFKAGHNVKLELAESVQTTDSLRPRTTITLNAVPGEGDGKYSPEDCSSNSSDVIRTINGVQANEFGDFQFMTPPDQPETCQWLHALPDGSLNFMNNCTQCLTCDKIEATYGQLTTIWANALLLRNRMCQSLVVYNDYLSLLNQFITELNTPKVSIVFEQSDFQSFDVIFRLQVGNVPITNINIDIDYATAVPEITAIFRQYSARRKIPGFAPTQLGPAFNGTNIGYMAGTPPTDPVLGKNRYAMWYWNMSFSRCDGDTDIPVSWSGTIDKEDGSTLFVSGSTTLTITPQDCSE